MRASLRSTDRLRRGAHVLPALAVTGLLPPAIVAANGGYFASSWGWSALGGAWLTAVGVASRPSTPLRRTWWTLLALVALAVWTFVSAAWAPAAGVAISAGERVVPILLIALAFVVCVRRAQLGAALVALVCGVGVVCAYGLATRLFADHFGVASAGSGSRLARPVGYWNGLGIYAALGLALAVGLVAHEKRAVRTVLALFIPLFATTLYFTYSRGAAIAAGLAFVVTFALETQRLRWLSRAAIALAAAAASILAASRATALTTAGMRLHRLVAEGHRLALIVAVLCLASAGVGMLPAGWFSWPRRLERRATVAFSVAIAAAIVAGIVFVGGPVGAARKFDAPPPATHGNLNARLFSFSGTDRAPLWRLAVHEYASRPLLGGGAGSYESYYLLHRSTANKVRNAHSLYLETLAELGPVGLVLLLLALLTPLTAVVRGRTNPLVPALAGAYAAFLVHLAVDWDWQLTGVAATGLLCGMGILVAAGDRDRVLSGSAQRVLLAATAAATALAFVLLAGNLYVSRATSAARAGDWAASARDAKKAERWMPWSSEPWQLLGEAQLATGDRGAAVVTLRRALAKDSHDWSIWFDLARVTLGPARDAALAHAADLDPLSPEIAELRHEIAAQTVITVSGRSG